MFANGAFPSDEEYELFNEKVKNTPGLAFYTDKTHSNYRSRLLREAKVRRMTRGDADAIEGMTGAGTV
ncbi:hypothetical protein TRAPUB_11737 [Trametes pubescens]|uniref:Uncharacterized protein n=1 Tax=Trametes pubescens TaxID=154538 RepID=A0A1M2VVW5_TRAPU|nr:hypothetical protein TRAPUB_11737 [Trametes pubescens]